MPERVTVYDRIPKSSYDADAILGTRTYLSIGYQTALVRDWDNDRIALQYNSSPIVRYYSSGSVEISTRGWNTRTTVRRIARALPPMWGIRYRMGGPPPELVYRNVYRCNLDNPTIFWANGNVNFCGYEITREMLDSEVADRLAFIDTPQWRRPSRSQRNRSALRSRASYTPDLIRYCSRCSGPFTRPSGCLHPGCCGLCCGSTPLARGPVVTLGALVRGPVVTLGALAAALI
jgi:hypothetical protein